jgi:C1A family cysteine protease
MISALLVGAMLCGLWAFGGGGFSSAAGSADVVITPPDGVRFINVPPTAFEDKINDEEYYRGLFGDAAPGSYPQSGGDVTAAAAARKGGASVHGITWRDLPDFNWRTDWNDTSKLAQTPKSSPVFPTRDQGAFGTCWAFAALASAEGNLVLGGQTTASPSNYLSPYHLVFSAYNEYTFAADVNTGDKDMNTYAKAAMNGGGNADMAGSAMSKWFGPASESQYKYPTVANPNAISSLSQLRQSRYHLQYALNFPAPNDKKSGVSGGIGAASLVPSQLNAIKNALYTYGPLAMSYHASGTYRQTGAYYSGSANGSTTYYQSANSYANHGVTMVGWNDSVPASAFDNGSGIRPKGSGAFLVQNSWGTSWGDGGGFFWLSYYDPSIGISTSLALENTANSDNVYYWDDLGYAGAKYYNLSWYSGSQIDYMCNVFTVGSQAAASSIDAVSVYAPAPGTKFEVSVYQNPPAGKPTGGLPLKIGDDSSTVVNSTAIFAGYQTIVFALPQHLSAGDTFSVVVHVLNNNADDSALTCEGVLYDYGDDADHVSIAKGQSYYSMDGKSWKDLAATYASAGSGLGNFNIRAFSTGIGISSIGISPAYPVQKTYRLGEAFNDKTGRIQINYADGTVGYVPLMNNNVHVEGFDSSKPGTRTVKLSYRGKTLSYQINVLQWTWVTGLSGIGGVPSMFRFTKGYTSNSINVSSSVLPANASDKRINWSVSGPARIASTGASTATLTFTGKEGYVTVTARSNDSARISRTARVLAAANVTSIASHAKTLYLKKNSSYTIPCVAYDANSPADTQLTFTTANANVLSIGANGKIKAKNVSKKTKAVVTATTQSGYRKTFTVYILPKATRLKSLKIVGAPKKMKLGAYRHLTLKYSPASATNLAPKFSSSNPKVVSVDKIGRICALKKGKARVTVRVGGKKAEAEISVG